MAFSLIASTHDGDGANGSTTPAIDTTGADLLVAAVGAYNLGVTWPSSFTDSAGNTWIQEAAAQNGNISGFIYSCVAPTTSTTHTFTISHTGSYASASILAMSGVDTVTPRPQSPVSNNAASATTIQPGSLTPGAAGNLMVTAIAHGHYSGGTMSLNSGYTVQEHQNYVGGTAVGSAIGYEEAPSTSALNPTWTWSSTSSQLVAFHLEFAAAAGGGGGTFQKLVGNKFRLAGAGGLAS